MDNLVNQHGISLESVESFIQRNNFAAKPKFPQELTSWHQVIKSKDIPFLPIDWETKQDWELMYGEAKKLSRHYVPHRTHETHKGWASLVIHGISSVHTESSHVYGYDTDTTPWRWTDIADLCPTITAFFQNVFDYNRYFRIRIMKLAPGGFIIPHRDSTEQENRIGPLNIALNNPSECKFYMDNVGYLPWIAGRMIKLNLYNVHCVYNNTNTDRYHLIVHGEMGESWKERIFNSYLYWKNIYG